MNPFRRKWLVGVLASSIAYAALIQGAVGQDGSRRAIDVRIEHRKVVSPKKAIRVSQNDDIELRWTSDELVSLHLHGYDQELRVEPGKPAVMVVRAHATGRFPITSHGWGSGGHGHHALTYLEVHPR